MSRTLIVRLYATFIALGCAWIAYTQAPQPQGKQQAKQANNSISKVAEDLYAIIGESNRLMVLVSLNCDTSDSWEREGDNPEYFQRFSPEGYALGIDIAIWVMSH